MNSGRNIAALADLIAFRLLLLLAGLALAECALRLTGIHPWPTTAPDPGRESLCQPDGQLGWIPNPHDHHRAFTGYQMHTETVGPDRLRLVVPQHQGAASETIMVLGESSIFGWGLDDDKTFPSFLARETGLPVLNAAVPGYGALQSVLWMKRLFQTNHAGRVILGYADFMLARDIAELSWISPAAEVSSDRNFRLPIARVKNGELEISEATPIFPEMPGRYTFAIVRLLEEITVVPGTLLRRSQKHEIARAIFTAWSKALTAAGSRGYVLFWKNDGTFQLLAEFLRTKGIMPLNCVHPDFGNPTTIIPGDGHPSAVTTAYWAQCVARQLE